METILNEDLSTITTIPKPALKNLESKIEWCILDSVERAVCSDNTECNIDMGFGSLVIKFSQDSVKYRFIPSDKLNDEVSDIVINERNSIAIPAIEESLVNKMLNVYKNFF